ncbi:MAG TPA: hypothetical protein VFI27_15715 [candidate division Zixibacteria bacterium]|nr:hypothetical protein [candidate division Zixibacteria bacterium]
MHGLIIEGTTNDATLAGSWKRSFAPLSNVAAAPDIRCHLDLVERIPEPPHFEPVYVQEGLLSYYSREDGVELYYPEFGRLIMDFRSGTTIGDFVHSCLETHGLLEDFIASGLSPHLRRRGLFLVHAFAAAKGGRFALLVGDIGAGKTTAGISLLDSGWRLMSNDSPIVTAGGRVLSYPGFLGAYPDTLAMFDSTKNLVPIPPDQRKKKEFAAESLWPNVWCDQAIPGVILFPQIQDSEHHSFHPLRKAETLGRLLPHTIESWDKPMLAPHLEVFEQLVEVSPSYALQLGRDVRALPELIGKVIERVD